MKNWIPFGNPFFVSGNSAAAWLKNLRVIKDFKVFRVLKVFNDPKNSKDPKDPMKF